MCILVLVQGGECKMGNRSSALFGSYRQSSSDGLVRLGGGESLSSD